MHMRTHAEAHLAFSVVLQVSISMGSPLPYVIMVCTVSTAYFICASSVGHSKGCQTGRSWCAGLNGSHGVIQDL